MIASMSNLFRYNLKTSEQIVPLEQELRWWRTYMYLQQMRFGSRIGYECRIDVDARRVMVPAFTLQPVVENAIIHGLSRKKSRAEGSFKGVEGRKQVIISVADTGLGMDEETLEELVTALKNSHTSKVGIGLGNIYQRIQTMYQNGGLRIYSKRGWTGNRHSDDNTAGGNMSMYRVLIADDEMIERKVLYKTLTENLGTSARFSRPKTGGSPAGL